MPSLNQFQRTKADWRATIAKNTRKTYVVIALFLAIYACLGLMIDVFIQSGHYGYVPLWQLLMALIQFELFPTATLVMLCVAGLSLLITFKLHDKIMLMGANAREITPANAQNHTEKQLYNIVEEMKVSAGLNYMPKVFIMDEDYMNAFASGYSEKSAIVAITRGLLSKLDRAELTAVMAHEISHIRHLDIKLTLTASVLANLMIIVLDILFYQAIFSHRNERQGRGNGLFIAIMILRYLLPIITLVLTLFLSRTREYMADAGCVQLMRDNEPLARALIKIHQDHQVNAERYAQEYAHPNESVRREAYIYDPAVAGIGAVKAVSNVFATHPSLESRLDALGFRKRV